MVAETQHRRHYQSDCFQNLMVLGLHLLTFLCLAALHTRMRFGLLSKNLRSLCNFLFQILFSSNHCALQHVARQAAEAVGDAGFFFVIIRLSICWCQPV